MAAVFSEMVSWLLLYSWSFVGPNVRSDWLFFVNMVEANARAGSNWKIVARAGYNTNLILSRGGKE